ncbi:DUF6326 family protein [Flavobacterium sp. FlaQc-28]|uniref:DUF6326 family protein n=1 Tax=Flavobacterium sp. FlaQc-28 TaxID=3374178 RepID=UPI003757449E
MAALVLAILAIMIALSILLNPRISRFLNITFIFFTAIMLLIALTSMGEPWRTFYVFYAFLESTITALIVWHAHKWSKQKTINLKSK